MKPRLLHALSAVFGTLAERSSNDALWGRGRCRALYGVDCIFAPSSRWQEDDGDGAMLSRRSGTDEADEADEADGADADGTRAAARRAASDVQPVILEVNFSPDYGQMLKMHPSFVDDAFAKLFLPGTDDSARTEADELWHTLPVAGNTDGV